jgi:addiction module RelB/DinJ family antitoxin
MMNTNEVSVIQTRVPASLRRNTEAIFNKMGMSLNDGIRIYLAQVEMDGGLPFRPQTRGEIPNEETMVALEDFKAGRHGQKMTMAEFENYAMSLAG